MGFKIVSQTRRRVRFRSDFKFGFDAGNLIADRIEAIPNVEGVEVNPRTGSVLVVFFGHKALKAVEHVLSDSEYEVRTMPKTIPTGTSVISDVAFWPSLRLLFGSFLPFPLRLGMFISGTKDIFFDGFKQLFRGKITVEVLDLSSVAIALVMRDFKTAATTALLLGLGESLEEWTRRKTMENLTESLAVNVDTVWIRKDGEDFEVPFSSLTKYDILVVRAGSAIAADGEVVGGDGMVNQVSMTGEPLPVHRTAGNVVFAGTTVEEGELLIRPTAIGSESRLNKIVEFIENSEKAKAGIEAKAMRLADTIVPYSFLLAGVVGAVTRNLAKVAAVLMVDYSCALKLATPIAFLSAMKEAANHKILIKGGKYLEALAQVDTVVFDKTGTLTVSSPKVSCVVPLDSKWSEKEILRMAACLEEHFPHPVARAVVRAAAERHLQHEEEHAEVEYIVGHGIASKLHGERLLIGSRHLVEDDEGVDCSFAQPEIDRIASKGHSVLYFVVGCTLSGLIGVEDPIRPEAKDVIQNLKLLGIKNIAMITGDGPRTAANVARRLGIMEYFSQVLPTGKSDIVRRMENEGRKVLMIGDGINDSPALSAATVGVTLSDGADLAKEVASVVLLNSDLTQLPVAIELGQKTYRRIEENFQITIGLNSIYLAGGLLGLIMPATGAVLHNVTTLGVAWNAQQPKLAEKYDQEEILELEYSDEALE